MTAGIYQPAKHVLDRLKRVDFVAVIGPTAAGKTTIINAAVARHPRLQLVLNETSRDRRPDEPVGQDYLFKSRAEMEARIAKGDYVQVAPSVFGDLYATAPEGYAVRGVAILAVLADTVPAFRQLPFKRFQAIFIVPPSWEVWQSRLQKHQFTPDQLVRRLHEAKKSLHFALSDQDVHFVVSETIELAAEDLAILALGKPLPERMQADQSRARTIIHELLGHLQAFKPFAPEVASNRQ